MYVFGVTRDRIPVMSFICIYLLFAISVVFPRKFHGIPWEFHISSIFTISLTFLTFVWIVTAISHGVSMWSCWAAMDRAAQPLARTMVDGGACCFFGVDSQTHLKLEAFVLLCLHSLCLVRAICLASLCRTNFPTSCCSLELASFHGFHRV